MKKLLLALSLMLMSVVGFSQSSYRAKMTEMYTYNTEKSEWVLYQKQSDVNITVVIEEEGFVYFHAKSPSMYKFDKNSGVDISGETFNGYRYDEVDLKRNESCKIDIIKTKSNNYVVSIVKMGKYNLRYYIYSEE